MNNLLNLSITHKQLETINAALDVYTRTCLGQFNYAIEATDHTKRVWEMTETERHEYKYLCDRLHILLTGFDANANHGICSDEIDKLALTAYDMHQVTRNFFYKERNPDGEVGYTVDSSVIILGDQPKMEITITDEIPKPTKPKSDRKRPTLLPNPPALSEIPEWIAPPW